MKGERRGRIKREREDQKGEEGKEEEKGIGGLGEERRGRQMRNFLGSSGGTSERFSVVLAF